MPNKEKEETGSVMPNHVLSEMKAGGNRLTLNFLWQFSHYRF